MLRTSLISVTESSINLADNEFDKGDCGEDEAKILLIISTSQNLTGAGYLTFGAQKAFNLLWQMFTQALIFQHFDLE